MIRDFREEIEQAATDAGNAADLNVLAVAAISIAISLKRIADTIPEGHAFSNQISNMAWDAGRSFEAGRKQQ